MENRKIFDELASDYQKALREGTSKNINEVKQAINTLLDYEICGRIVSNKPTLGTKTKD